MDYNKVILVGRLTRDIEESSTNTGKCVARFTLAVSRRMYDKTKEKETDFVPCVAFGSTAEFLRNYIGKGRMILVEGRIAVDKYQDNEGNDKIFTKIIVSEVVALDKKSENSGETKKVDVSLKGTFYQNQNVEQPEIIYESEEISGDELPF